MFKRPIYRTRQLIGALNPQIEISERSEAEQLLGRKLWPLFESMTKRDQRHSLDVYRTLKGQGRTDRDLLIASSPLSTVVSEKSSVAKIIPITLRMVSESSATRTVAAYGFAMACLLRALRGRREEQVVVG